MILCVSIFISSRNFKERALALKTCYIKLDKIYRRALHEEKDAGEGWSSELEDIEDSYDDLLLFSENHSIYDYLNLRHRIGKEDETHKLNKTEYIKLLSYKIFRILILSVLFSIPIILLLWI